MGASLIAVWQEISRNALRAAEYCLHRQCDRSAISRAYNAVFAAMTDRLRRVGLTPPSGRESWSHESLPRMFMVHLSSDFPPAAANEVSRRLRSLYRDRIIADYTSGSVVDSRAARRTVAAAQMVDEKLLD